MRGSTLEWRKSSRSGTGSGGSCVEIALLAGAVGVRDSKHPATRLTFDRRAWETFVRDAR
jgi:Domain of unknown function (DUF397)